MFDLGGVVIDYSNADYYAYLGRRHKIPESKVKKIIEGKYIDALEKDKLSIKSFESKLAKDLGVTKKKIEWYQFYKKRARINVDVAALVRLLHKDYITAYISNIDRTRYFYTMKILDLDDFDYRFTSCYVKSRKPEAKIFNYVLKRIGIKASEAVFIDNMLENVLGARKLGITSIHFINRRRLDVELGKLRL